MIVTDAMKEQMAMLEDVIENAIIENLPPIGASLVLGSPMYSEYLTKVENLIMMHMDSNTGEIDGAKAHESLQLMYPQLTQWVSIPRKKFFIKNEINELGKILIGREVM